MLTIKEYLGSNPYPGRGILLGISPNGEFAIAAYFLMGRSENSRNRVFVRDEQGLKTEAHDPDKLSDPSLIIYNAITGFGKHTIVTNGDHTDTIYNALYRGQTFEQALRTREYEPDAPNFTPRISGLLTVDGSQASYKLSILKHGGNGSCQRFFYEYPNPQPGVGHIIHTYMGDGDPLPSFTGEPVPLPTSDDNIAYMRELWAVLNENNRVAVHVQHLPLYYNKTQECGTNRFENKD